MASMTNAALNPAASAGTAPAWSINKPAKKGPMKLETEGPIANQLNDSLS